MLKKILLLSIIFVLSFSKEQTEIEQKEKNFRNDHPNKPTVIRKTYKEATNDSNVKNWNNKDWESHMQRNGIFDTGLIGNSQNNAGTLGSDIIHNANPNQLSTSSLRQNESLKDNKSLFGYSDEIQKSIFDGNNARESGRINITQTTKCYIAREMPIRFRCSKTGLIYGAGINTGGSDAQKICESECYEQYSCVNVSPPQQTNANTLHIDNLVLTQEQEEITFEKDIINGLKLSSMTFEVEKSKDKVFLDFIITASDNTERVINKKLLLKDKQHTFGINQFAKSIKIVLYGENIKSEAIMKNINIVFKPETKFICPANQDITASSPGDFAYVCPSGKVKTLFGKAGTYKICEDYGVVGDNEDGTFSTLEGCNNSCKNSFSCILDNSALSTASLQNFREGCIEGQSDCTLETCKNLRIAKTQVLNEYVFRGDFEATPTVVNGSLIKGVERPKVLLDDDINFIERSKEEWKDGAYNDMIKRGAYRATKFNINENTEVSNAYNMGVASNSIDGTDAGALVNSLYWIFKPRAFDVNNKSYKFYAILEIIVDNIKRDEYGNTYRDRDKILYVKTSEGDFFKPFAIKKGFAKKTSNKVEDAVTLTSLWEYQYFNISLKNWFEHSKYTSVEFFKNAPIEINGPFIRIPIVSNYNKLMYQLPGIVRKKIQNGPTERKEYSGIFDGSGQAITSVKLFVDYSLNSTLTYADVVSKIDNEEWIPIYNNANITSSPKAVISDTMIETDSIKYHNNENRNSKEDIEIFIYGTENKKTGYTRIKPKAEDVGKKGFIFIFAQ